MKKLTALLLSVLLLFSLLPASVLAAGETLEAVSLSGPGATLVQGESSGLTAVLTDSEGGTYSGSVDLKYESTNDYIATVDGNGKITAKHPGSVTFIVTAAADGVTVSDTYTIQVVAGFTGCTFEDTAVGSLPGAFTGASASVQQESASNRALKIPADSFVEYAFSGSRATIDFDIWAASAVSVKVEFLSGATVLAAYQAECSTAPGAWHFEADADGSVLLVSVDGKYKAPIALNTAADKVRITAAGAAVWVDNFDCRSGIYTDAIDFEKMTVGEAPTGFSNLIQTSVTDTNAFESRQSMMVNDASASQAGSARLTGVKSAAQTIDFDLYFESASSGGGVSMKILNGGISNANTAFWIRFYNGSIHAYTGTWNTIGTGVPYKKWINVHIEASVDGSAQIYIDGTLAAVCPRTDSGTAAYGGNTKTQIDSYLFFTGGNAYTGDLYYVDNLSIRPAAVKLDETPSLAETTVSERVNIALNSEPVLKDDGTPYDVDYINEDYADGFGWAQIPFLFVDSGYDTAYINYSRHRDVTMDDPIDSVKIYDTDTITDALDKGITDLTGKYDAMKTDYDLFLMSMTEIKTGPYAGCYFAQNYIPYFTGKNTASTVSWIVDPADGSWTKINGTLTLSDKAFNVTDPISGVNWFPIVFSKGIEILDDGTILQTMYGNNKAILVESTDWGKTWTLRSVIAENNSGDRNTDGSTLAFYEPNLQRCADGTLLSVIRTGSNLPLYQARSRDNGLTWSSYELLPGIGTTVVGSIYPQSVLLDNGILVLTTGRPGNSILLSLDGSGRNWGYATSTMVPAIGESTTGNTSIAKISGNSVLIVGDRGFVQDKEAGIWAVTADITRRSTESAEIDFAYLNASETLVPLAGTMQLSLGSIIDTNGNAIPLSDCTVSYYSLQPEIAGAAENGVITANAVGTAELVAAVTYKGITINTNTIPIKVADPDVIKDVSAKVEDWTIAPGASTNVIVAALNEFGTKLDAAVTYTSRNTDVFTVSEDGVLTGVAPGVSAVDVTVSYKGQTISKTINVIIESSTWYLDSYDELETGDVLPETHTRITSTAGIITDDRSFSGPNSFYVKDDITSAGIQLTSSFAPAQGAVIEFMMNIERLEHLASIGIGSGRTNTNNESAWFAFATPNYSGGPIRLHSYNGSGWMNVSGNIGAALNEWFKVRIEITVDKPALLYVNDQLVTSLFVVKNLDSIDRLRFTTGGANYVDDWYYIDDLKIMTFNDPDAPRLSSICSGGTVIPGFDPDVFNYQLRLPLSSRTRQISATAASDGDTVSIEGTLNHRIITVTGTHGVTVYTLDIQYIPVSDASEGEPQDQLVFRDDAAVTRYIDGYTDGSFGIRGSVTRAELATMLYRLSDTSNALRSGIQFTDVPDDFWAADAIDVMTSYQIFLWEGTAFEPNKPATRAEVTRALVLLSGLEPLETASTFTDCSGHPLDGFIAAAQAYGIVDGYDDGSFRPDATITRSEVVAIINRTIGMAGEAGASVFTDVAPDFWALEYINAAAIR